MPNDEPEITLTDTPTDFQTPAKFAYPNVKSLVRLFFVLFFYEIVCGIPIWLLIAILSMTGSNVPLLNSFLTLSLYLVTFFLVISYAIKRCTTLLHSPVIFSFNKIPGWLVPIIFVSSMAFFVGIERVAHFIPIPKAVQKFLGGAFSKDIFSITTIVIAAPILEEILCRGIVLKGLLKNYPANKAILISAIFFAAIHMNPWQALPAFCDGLFIGWVFYRTQSIIPGMIIHATINTVATLLMFLPQRQQNLLSLFGMPHYIVLCVLSVVVFVCGCVIINKRSATIPIK